MENKYLTIKEDLKQLGFHYSGGKATETICDIFETKDNEYIITYRYGSYGFTLEKKTNVKWERLFGGIVKNKSELLNVLNKYHK